MPMTTEPGNYRYLRFTPFGAAAEGAWARPAPNRVALWERIGPAQRLMTEGDYVTMRIAAARMKGPEGKYLREIVEAEDAEYERLRQEAIERKRQTRLAREKQYQKDMRRRVEEEAYREKRLRDRDERARLVKQARIEREAMTFEEWLLKQGIITIDEAKWHKLRRGAPE